MMQTVAQAASPNDDTKTWSRVGRDQRTGTIIVFDFTSDGAAFNPKDRVKLTIAAPGTPALYFEADSLEDVTAFLETDEDFGINVASLEWLVGGPCVPPQGMYPDWQPRRLGEVLIGVCHDMRVIVFLTDEIGPVHVGSAVISSQMTVGAMVGARLEDLGVEGLCRAHNIAAADIRQWFSPSNDFRDQIIAAGVLNKITHRATGSDELCRMAERAMSSLCPTPDASLN